jgi:hypothetical protein
MSTNLLKDTWNEIDPGEIRFILYEHIGQPGQYLNRAENPGMFYLPLADSTCRIKLTYSDNKQLVAIEPGAAFDADQWASIVDEIESKGPIKVGRDCSFNGFHVTGSWSGKRSGVQILPPPPNAPVAPCEMAEHPFILEFPLKVSERWPITNYRRMREHRRLTHLLNILLAGRTSMQPRRSRHLWATVPGDAQFGVKWVQEFFFANFGEAVIDSLSPLTAESIAGIDADAYYTIWTTVGQGLRVPSDLDDLICCYLQLSRLHRASFDRAGFWMDMASRQWTISLSASFASLVIAIEAASDRKKKPTARFRDFLEQYAPGVSLEERRNKMYGLRSDILHGSGLMEMDQDTDFGWSPPEQNEKDIMEELWGITRLALRNWLKNPLPA